MWNRGGLVMDYSLNLIIIPLSAEEVFAEAGELAYNAFKN
jgi:hypothetical protein